MAAQEASAAAAAAAAALEAAVCAFGAAGAAAAARAAAPAATGPSLGFNSASSGGTSYLGAAATDPTSGYTPGAYDGNGFVSITEVSGGAVPEPSAWALMGVGFGALGLMALRRKRRPGVA